MSVTISAQTSIERDQHLIADAIRVRYNPVVISHAEDGEIFDVEGRRYLDFGAGWALAGLGYSNAHVRAAVTRQFDRTTFAGLLSAINVPALDLAEKLVSLVPGDFPKKVWYGLSGSDAAEAAHRLVLMAAHGKHRIVSFVGGWHGMSDAMMGLSAHPAFTWAASSSHVTKVPYPNPYRNPFGDGSGDVTDQCLRFLEDYLFQTICPSEEVAAIFVEAIQSDAGDVVPPPDFMPKLRALCDRHDIWLVVNEIKVGLGRTGRMFSFEHGGIAPDLVLLGKSLGGGLPLSAVVGRAEIMDIGSGVALMTTAGNATCCAAGLAVIEEIERLDLVNRAAETGHYLGQRLHETLMKHSIVGDVRGLGMIQGVELVTDRASKHPNQPAAAKVVYRAWELGLILYYAGNWGNVVEITPPLILTRDQIDEGVAILDQAIADTLAGTVDEAAVAAFAGW